MKRYFAELSEMYEFVSQPGIKMISYSFTFAYGYELIYKEVSNHDCQNQQ